MVALQRRHVKSFRTRELSNVMWALSKLGPVPGREQLVRQLLEEAAGQLSYFNAQDTSNFLLALAHMEERSCGDLLEALCAEAAGKLPSFKTQELANSAWAIAKLDVRGERATAFLGLLLQEAAGRLQTCQPQELSNMVWALATLGWQEPAFVDALLKETAKQLHTFSPQHLANTLWALATLGHECPPGFMPALLGYSKERFAAFKTLELTIMAWSLAVMR